MELMNSFIVFENIGSFLLWTVVVSELLSLAKNAIVLPSNDTQLPSRTDALSRIDRLLDFCFWKCLFCVQQLSKYVWQSLSRCIYLSLEHSWRCLSHSIYPFLFGEIVPEADHARVNRHCHGDFEYVSWKPEEAMDVKVDKAEERDNHVRSQVDSSRKSSSGELYFHRLRSGTVYGMSVSPKRSPSSDIIFGGRTPMHFKVPEENKKENNSNVFGNNGKLRSLTKTSEKVLRYGRPRSLLKANVPQESLRSLGYFARSRRVM